MDLLEQNLLRAHQAQYVLAGKYSEITWQPFNDFLDRIEPKY
jgi:hypothetical protein